MAGTGESIIGFRISALSVKCPKDSEAKVCVWSYSGQRASLVGIKMGDAL